MALASNPDLLRTECRAFGIVPGRNLHELHSVLKGMSSRYKEMHVQEVVLRVPLQGGSASTQLRLSRDITKDKASGSTNQTDRWLLQHEGLPLRGQAASALPAAVQDVTDRGCGVNARQFWMGLGAHQECSVEKNGNEYVCMHQGYEIKVHLICVTTTTTARPPGAPALPTPAGSWIADLRVRVPDGAHVAASHAIGSFAAKLLPLVTLQPACDSHTWFRSTR